MAQAVKPHPGLKEMFADRTAVGLFVAPWMELPPGEPIVAVENLSENLKQQPVHRGDISLVLGHLLAVRGHCERAAAAREPRACRRHYGAALQECEAAIDRLHGAEGDTAAALNAWARGVHTLIRAQVAAAHTPSEGRSLAYEALSQLSGPRDALTVGAEADARAAMQLVREPAELEGRLLRLPDDVRTAVDGVEQNLERRLGELNRAVAAVRERHGQALAWVVGWGALNLLLMAAGPINAIWASSVPWSLPFIVGLPVLWWATWALAFRNGLPFFGYVRQLRTESIAAFRKAADRLPNPLAELGAAAGPLLEAGQRDHARLSRFYLYQIPEACDTCWKARAIVEGARERLSGAWVADMIDQAPQPLAEVLRTEARIPAITGIRFEQR